MSGIKLFNKLFFISLGIAVLNPVVFAQEKVKPDEPQGTAVMWQAVNIGSRDLYWGPGGESMSPKLKNATFVAHQPGGNNLKYRIKDGDGREWIVKIADESQPEVAAVRLLWAIGYKTEINYLAPKLAISKIGGGKYSNVRLEARPEGVKRQDMWSWTNNPFGASNEFHGLKIMMAMLNNWDLKDENNVVLKNGDELQYVISDLGASFGRLAKTSDSRSGRSVNEPEHFAQSNFIKGVKDGYIEFDYRGQADHLIKGIKVEHARWLADLLIQLSDKQISDAFRAANYSPEDTVLLTEAFRTRINMLDKATNSGVASN